jgi:hypothetical protein
MHTHTTNVCDIMDLLFIVSRKFHGASCIIECVHYIKTRSRHEDNGLLTTRLL